MRETFTCTISAQICGYALLIIKVLWPEQRKS